MPSTHKTPGFDPASQKKKKGERKVQKGRGEGKGKKRRGLKM